MPKIVKFLITLLIVSILGAAFAITWLLYFDNPENEQGGNQEQTTTSSKTESKEGFKFAVCGDPHANWDVYEKVLESAEKKGVEFLVNVGDLTRVGAESEYLEGKKLMEEFNYDTYLVMGGHDRISDGTKWYRKYFGRDYYTWNEGDAHFVVLNNSDQKEGIFSDHLKWLDDDLMKNDLPLVFVFVHQPVGFPYASLEMVGYLTAKAQESEQDLANILKRHKIKALFSGHLHSYFPYQFEGISAIITGGAGGPPQKLPFLETTPFHYVLVTVSDNEVDYEMIEVE